LEISSTTCFASSLRSIAAEPIAEDDAELIAAEPRHGSPLHNSRQALGDHLENFVAEPAIDVVDRLEIVEVHHEERAGLALRRMGLDHRWKSSMNQRRLRPVSTS
jgi:hypothetical protein